MRNNTITTVQEKEEIEFTAKKPEEVKIGRAHV